MASESIVLNQKIEIHITHNGLDKKVSGYFTEAPEPVPPVPPIPPVPSRNTYTIRGSANWELGKGEYRAYIYDDRINYETDKLYYIQFTSGMVDFTKMSYIAVSIHDDNPCIIIEALDRSAINADEPLTFTAIMHRETETEKCAQTYRSWLTDGSTFIEIGGNDADELVCWAASCGNVEGATADVFGGEVWLNRDNEPDPNDKVYAAAIYTVAATNDEPRLDL